MNDLLASMREELEAMLAGRTIPYHKAAVMMAAMTALLFSIFLTHFSNFESPVTVIDLDASAASTRLIERINASSYVRVASVVHNAVDPRAFLSHDRSVGTLLIPKGYEKAVLRGSRSFRLGYFADDTNLAQNSNTSETLGEMIPEAGAELAAGRTGPLALGATETQAIVNQLSLVTRPLFNPVKQSTNAVAYAFVFFFSSIIYCLTVLMLVGRLKVSGMWERCVLARGPFCLLARLVPYALIYTAVLSAIFSVLICFGQQRFAGNWFVFLPAVFMTALAIGCIAVILTFSHTNPAQGGQLMILIVPPGFIMGGVLMSMWVLPAWAAIVKMLFPLCWLFEFWRDIAVRGVGPMGMMHSYGLFLAYLAALMAAVSILFFRDRRRAARLAG